MMNMLVATVKHALMITGFVGVMMLVIEYANVLTRGRWQERLSRGRWGQYLLASLFGAMPGCLGAFAVVAMYAHRTMTVGAVAAAMIATAGDESFVMFALIPRTALLLHMFLFLLGLAAGALTDAVLGRRFTARLSCKTDFSAHDEKDCVCFDPATIAQQWQRCTGTRGMLVGVLLLFFLGICSGQIGPSAWNWIRISLMAVSLVALFIVVTVPDHFLDEHLWHHVVRGHVPRVFLWTLGALLVMHLASSQWGLDDKIRASRWVMLVLAGLVGLIPESGPHYVFVTLYSQGMVPFSVLLASSIVQDGHGMLPLLAHSRRAFLVVKLVNLVIGLAVGGLFMLVGR